MSLLFIIIYLSILAQVNEGKQRFFCDCGPIHTRLRMFCNALNWAAAVATSPRSNRHGLRRSVIFQTVRDVLFQMCRENLIPLLVRGQICSAGIKSLGKMSQRASGAQALLFQGDGVSKPITWFGLNVLPAAGSGWHQRLNTSLLSIDACRFAACRCEVWLMGDDSQLHSRTPFSHFTVTVSQRTRHSVEDGTRGNTEPLSQTANKKWWINICWSRAVDTVVYLEVLEHMFLWTNAQFECGF